VRRFRLGVRPRGVGGFIGALTLLCGAIATADAQKASPARSSHVELLYQAHHTREPSLRCPAKPSARKPQQPTCVTGRWYRSTSAWNTRIPANPPIAPHSSSLIAAFNDRWCRNASCLGPTMVSVPTVWIASRATPKVTVQINFPTCDAHRVQAPIPAHAVPDGPPEGDMTVMMRDSGVEWDFFKLTLPGVTPLSSGPVCQATENWAATVVTRAHPGWTGSGTLRRSPRGSGTLYGSGLIRPRDTRRPPGSTWDHAVALAYRGTLAGTYVWPAVRTDGKCRDATACIPEGGRLQLDPAIQCAKWASLTAEWQRQLCRTLQRYGLIIVDTGSAILVQNPISLSGYAYPWAPNWGNLPADLAQHLRVIDSTRWTALEKPRATPAD
jgi:hypothetical protein